MIPITYDIIICILDYLRCEPHWLFNCSLVNHTFSEAVSRILYSRVVYSPEYSRVLDLRRKDQFSEGRLHSACLPHNACHVLYFEISGYPSPRPPSMNPLATHLEQALKCWRHVTTVVLAPQQYHHDLFTNVLPLLRDCAFLQNLTVNASCTDEMRAPILTSICGLKQLTIENPSRAILQLLPEWLSRLAGSLKGYHLTDNCGSITPGVLRSFLPHISQLHAFSLGLSYSLTDGDVFSFLQELPNLCSLDLRYYLQLRPPSTLPKLCQLRTLTVRYDPITTTDHAGLLCKWIRRVVAHAPLAELRLICAEESRGASVSVDGLIEHLSQKHSATLRILRMDTAFIGRDALRKLCARCALLEEVAVAISGDVLALLPEIFAPLHALHTVRVETRNAKRSRVFIDTPKAEDIITRGPDSLRRLVVDGVHWEGQWVTNAHMKVEFVVEQLDARRAAACDQQSMQDHP